MQRKAISFEQLSDIFGFRVIVDDVLDCYKALGLAHTKWSTVPGRFKDYISTPKQNDYRSIHTTVIGPHNQRRNCRSAHARWTISTSTALRAHALYKDAKGNDQESIFGDSSHAYRWLRRTLDLLMEGDSPEEFLEHTRLELFHDQVFCFTPKASSSPCRVARHPSISPMPCIRPSAMRRRGAGSTAGKCRSSRNSRMAMRSRSSAVGQPAAGRLGDGGRHRQGAGGHPPRDARRSAQAVFGPWPPHHRKRLPPGWESYDEDKLKAVVSRLARPSLEDVFASVGRVK